MGCVLKGECNIPRRPWSLEKLNFLLKYSGGILSWLAYCHKFLTSASGGHVLIAWENLALKEAEKHNLETGGGRGERSERESERVLFCWKDEGKQTKFLLLVNSGTSLIEQHEHTSRVQIIDKGKRKDSLWAGIRTWGFPDVKNTLYLNNLFSRRKGEHFSWVMPVKLILLY